MIARNLKELIAQRNSSQLDKHNLWHQPIEGVVRNIHAISQWMWAMYDT